MHPHRLSKPLSSLFMLSLLFAAGACGGQSSDEEPTRPPSEATNVNANLLVRPEYGRTEFPRLRDKNAIVLVKKTADKFDADGVNYAVEWDMVKKAQRWCAYRMHKGYTGNAGYYGLFQEDPDLPVSARFSDTNAMYSGSGFTRGHICPSADRQYSKEANRQTFYYTNIHPQYYNFNAGRNYTGVWVVMEDRLRKWTAQLPATDTLFVVKGGTIEDGRVLTPVKGKLVVPAYFFVALLHKSPQGYRPLAFLFEHNNDVLSKVSLGDYVLSIRDLEEFTQVDFFCNLPDKVEQTLETMPADRIRSIWGL
ncbi:MAG: DNA/RNA non-specific endonuclease [Prevotella sp.]|nr:DNA/RNA non-specific endonuclease [Prevotella sp.]